MPFTLDATLDWLVVDGTDTAAYGAAAAQCMTIPDETHPSSGWIRLALRDGAELAREVPLESPGS